MYRYALPFPVLPGKSDVDAKAISEYFQAHPDEYRESRGAAGVTLERAYLQKTPMGSFVVAYLESKGDPESTFAAAADTSKPLNSKFAEFVKEFHGVDITQTAPSVEVLGSWRDDQVSGVRKGLAFSAPLLPGKVYVAPGGGTHLEVAGASTPRCSLRDGEPVNGHRPSVDMLFHSMARTVGGKAVEVTPKEFASDAPYDRWFKDQLKGLFPPEIDFDQPVPGIEEIFDSRELLVRS